MSSSPEQSANLNHPAPETSKPTVETNLHSPKRRQDTTPPVPPVRESSEPAAAKPVSPQTLRRPPVRPAPPPPPDPVPAAKPVAPEVTAQAPESSTTQAETLAWNRQQPIPPPSEPMQYRAIGLVRGRYIPSEEQFNRGDLVGEDGTELKAVLLGQVMSLVKKHLDLEQDHLWVVYPRTREKQRSLHVQILGVWEPEKLQKAQMDETEPGSFDPTEFQLPAPQGDGYFSIRGEVIFQSPEKSFLVVKIQQAPRKSTDRPKAFKLRLEGTLAIKAPGYFWDIEVRREDNSLVIVKGQSVALIPPKKNAKKAGDRYPLPRKSGPRLGRTGESKFVPPTSTVRREPAGKPIKRQNRSPASD